MMYLGIDLGGTNIAAGLVDQEFRVVAKVAVPTPSGAGTTGETLSDAMAAVVRELLDQQGMSLNHLPWVGVGAPGYIDSKLGINRFAGNLCGGLRDDPMAENLSKRLGGAVVYLGNDANAAAYGEAVAGAARGAKSSITVTLGTGVGGGIIIEGAKGFVVGEVGHTTIVYEGELCTCGRKGCWEAYASATALIRQTRAAMEAAPGSALWQAAGGTLEGVTGKTAFDAADQGDETAARVVDRYVGYVACGVANLINILEPEVICLGGGISGQGEKLLAPLRAKVRPRAFQAEAVDRMKILQATLGNDAGIIGAAMLGKLLG